MCGIGKSTTLNVTISKTPEKEICSYSTKIVDASEWDVVSIWSDILDICEKCELPYILINDKSGFIRDDAELPYDVSEVVSSCKRGSASILGIKLGNGKLLSGPECQQMHDFVNNSCSEGDVLGYYD